METNGLLLGRQVGEFRLLEWIGEGGMGATYRAEQQTLKREAVVKVITAADTSEESKVRFLREARLASRLDHPYAAHIYAFGAEDDGLLWIAMELVRGIPLDRMLASEGAMPLARFVAFFDRLCEVVYSAHEQGIIHRDIKPSNVMVVRRAGRLLPKLLDFGIARTALEVEQPATGEVSDSPLDDSTRSITIRGRLVGSPDYMAPEQWVDATRATARTDLYALAITAYELLTGRRPFTGPTVLATARAHARNQVPALGPGFPAGLEHVFARALAKREQQRYDNVLELGAAIREAARETVGVATDFDDVVRETLVQHGPQPLAEALLELAAARDPAAAWDAGWRVVHVLVRTLAVIALAARVRVGERELGERATAKLRALVERGLDSNEWIELITALVEPFARETGAIRGTDRAHAHPVPELVGAMWLDGKPRGLFDALHAVRRGDDAIEAVRVRELLGELGKVLRACAFITDYAWVVCSDGGELWMGPRRNPRERLPLPAAARPGSVWLLDNDRAPVVELSPFVRVAPPAPGTDDEAFLIDGPARRGARTVAWPREFERWDDELWQFVSDHLAPLGRRALAADAEAAPYRGLASFGPGDAAMFFGREREVEAVVNRLRVQPLLAVVGPSGVGKSSFVHAGVLPALPDSWQTLSLRPGAAPLDALEARLATAGIAAGGLAERLRRDAGALAQLLDDAAHRQGARVLVVIDQLEEMFTQCRDVATREQFARALAAIDGASVHVILTLRDDFLVRAAELPGLGPRLASSLELVMLPDPDALRRILVEPLRRAGYTYELESLPDDMVAAVRERPGALALLSFAASKLWELRDRGFRHIPKRAYEAIGGVAGALARHAEDTLSALPPDEHGLVRELFRHLVTSEGTRALLRRDEAIQLLGKGASAERVIETLVERRLIVSFEDVDTERVEVIHEALLTAWPRLVGWQREDSEGARLRDQLRSAARPWGERGRPKGLLWRGEALVELKLWRSRQRTALTDLEHEFTAASIADEARTRLLRRLALAAVIGGLVIGLIVLQRANRAAERNAAESERTTRAMLVEQGRAALIAGRPQDATVYLSEAFTRGADDPNLPFLLGECRRALAGQLLVLTGHAGGVKWAETTEDGRRIVSAGVDGTVRVWNAGTGALERTLSGHDRAPFVVPSLTHGDGVLTWGTTARPSVWDLATGALRFTLPVAAGTFTAVTSDRTTIVTLEPGRLRAWSAGDGSPRGEQALAVQPRPGWGAGLASGLRLSGSRYAVDVAGDVAIGPVDFSAPPALVAGAAGTSYFGGGGRWLVSAPITGRTLRLWDVDQPGEPQLLAGHAGDVVSAWLSRDGARVASLSTDRTAKLWDTASGKLHVSLDGHDGYLFSLAFSPDGARIATGSLDHTVRLWDADRGAPRRVFYGHTDVMLRLSFDATGDRIISPSLDGSVRVFDARPTGQVHELRHEGPLTLRFSADGRRIIVVGHDRSAWVYDVRARAVVAAIDEYRAPVKASRLGLNRRRACGDLDARGETVVIPAGREARVIALADRGRPLVIGPHDADVSCARFTTDGGVVTAMVDGRVVLWDRRGRLLRTLALHNDRITEIDFDPRTGRLATASRDGTAKLVLGELSRTITPGNGPVLGIAFSHGGARIATASQDTVARVFDAFTIAPLVASHSVSDIESVTFSADDLRVAIGNNDGTVAIYDSRDGRLLAHMGDSSLGWITGIGFSPLDDVLITADDHGQIRTWPIDVETRSPALVARDVACRIPFQLVGSHLIARTVPPCGHL